MATDKAKKNQKKPRGKNGGARPGAGRPKGKLSAENAALLAAKKRFMTRVAKNTDKLFNAQLCKAVGETFLMRKVTEYAPTKRGKKGKVTHVYHEVVTDPHTILAYLDGELDGSDSINDDENYYYMTTKPADNSAIADMLNRGMGRPTEHIEADVTSDGERITSVSENQLSQLIRARTERSNL